MTIKRVCVIGIGTMGSQIGIVSARAGFQTLMVDASQDRIERVWRISIPFWRVSKKKERWRVRR